MKNNKHLMAMVEIMHKAFPGERKKSREFCDKVGNKDERSRETKDRIRIV